MSALTIEEITKLLSETKKRGVYEPRIDTFAKSGELAVNFTEFPEFSGMDPNAVRNSINNNVEKKSKDNNWPKFQVVVDKSDKDNPQVVLINLDAFSVANTNEV